MQSRFPKPPPAEANPELDRLRRVWQTLGRDDPLWAVLSHADKRGGRWQADEFFETGRIEIESQLDALAAHGLPLRRDLAVDFGCGAGRLSRALARRFERVIGIDVSASMVDTARTLNGDVPNVEFRENHSPRLDGIADASVDFVFSHITLQHVPGPLAAGYANEFFRILAPGGVAVFQFVDGADASLRGRVFALASNGWLNPVRRLLWRRRDVFEMHVLPEKEVAAALSAHPDLRRLDAIDDAAAGPGWRGRRWSVVNTAEVPQRVVLDDAVVHVHSSDVHVGAPVAAGRPHEPHVADVMRQRLRAGDVVLDIGANVGLMSLLAAGRVGASGRVIAVEPILRNRRLLARSAQASGYAQIEVIAAAASDTRGQIDLQTHPTTSNAATLAAAGDRLRSHGGRVERVDAVVLDEELGDLARLDLVKVDVAGMEPRALRGLHDNLRRWRPVLLSEFHPWAIERAGGESPLSYLRWLRELYPAICVLGHDGSRTRCVDPEDVIAAWRRANEAADAGGRLHLDLLLEPEA